MNSAGYLVFLLGLISFSSSNPLSHKTTNLNSFSLLEELTVLALSHLQQKEQNLAFRSLLDDEWGLRLLDTYFIDMRTLLTQNIKVSEESSLPALQWSDGFQSCLPDECPDMVINLTSNNTRMIGQKRITSVNTVTPTFFKNSFHSPSFTWHSPDSLLNISLRDRYDALLGDVYFSLHNLSIDTSFYYKFVPALGIQISNLDIQHNVGHIRANIENITQVFPDGSVRVYDSFKYDRTDRIIDSWKYAKFEYQDYLQLRINCFLSSYRLDPIGCNGSEFLTNDYFNRNILQLIQTVGLGSLDRY